MPPAANSNEIILMILLLLLLPLLFLAIGIAIINSTFFAIIFIIAVNEL